MFPGCEVISSFCFEFVLFSAGLSQSSSRGVEKSNLVAFHKAVAAQLVHIE